jgi:hypothetical protein
MGAGGKIDYSLTGRIARRQGPQRRGEERLLDDLKRFSPPPPRDTFIRRQGAANPLGKIGSRGKSEQERRFQRTALAMAEAGHDLGINDEDLRKLDSVMVELGEKPEAQA